MSAARHPRTRSAPKNAVNPSLGAPPRRPWRGRFSERFWTGDAVGAEAFGPLASHGLCLGCVRVPCANVLSHLNFAPLIETG